MADSRPNRRPHRQRAKGRQRNGEANQPLVDDHMPHPALLLALEHMSARRRADAPLVPPPRSARASTNKACAAMVSDFAKTFAADFAAHGAATIAKLRDRDAAAYLRLAADLEPAAENEELLADFSNEGTER